MEPLLPEPRIKNKPSPYLQALCGIGLSFLKLFLFLLESDCLWQTNSCGAVEQGQCPLQNSTLECKTAKKADSQGCHNDQMHSALSGWPVKSTSSIILFQMLSQHHILTILSVCCSSRAALSSPGNHTNDLCWAGLSLILPGCSCLWRQTATLCLSQTLWQPPQR